MSLANQVSCTLAADAQDDQDGQARHVGSRFCEICANSLASHASRRLAVVAALTGALVFPSTVSLGSVQDLFGERSALAQELDQEFNRAVRGAQVESARGELAEGAFGAQPQFAPWRAIEVAASDCERVTLVEPFAWTPAQPFGLLLEQDLCGALSLRACASVESTIETNADDRGESRAAAAWQSSVALEWKINSMWSASLGATWLGPGAEIFGTDLETALSGASASDEFSKNTSAGALWLRIGASF